MNTTSTPAHNRYRLVVFGCTLLDLALPCAGTSLLRRAPAGRWGMVWWMGFSIVMAMWTMSLMINALQALLLYVTMWVTVQINLQSRNVESLIRGPSPKELAWFERRFSGRKISILLILLVYIVTPTIFLSRAGDRLALLTVNDFGSFPNILPGETVLVLKSMSRHPRQGELVVWNSEHGTALGRVVATGGMEVSVNDGVVVLNGRPSLASPRESVAFRDFRLSESEAAEASRLQVFSEYYGDMLIPSMAFIREGVHVDSRSFVVPDGNVFILSDNRSAQTGFDSRNVGPVSEANIAGRPLFVLLSPGENWLFRLERTGAMPR